MTLRKTKNESTYFFIPNNRPKIKMLSHSLCNYIMIYINAILTRIKKKKEKTQLGLCNVCNVSIHERK